MTQQRIKAQFDRVDPDSLKLAISRVSTTMPGDWQTILDAIAQQSILPKVDMLTNEQIIRAAERANGALIVLDKLRRGGE